MRANATSAGGDYAPLEGWSRKVKLSPQHPSAAPAAVHPLEPPVAVSARQEQTVAGALEETAACGRFRLKPACVVEGIAWLRGDTVYRGRAGGGEVSTVLLWDPNSGDSLEVLRGSVIRLTEAEQSS